jgi:hypothetical protein
MSKAMHDPPDTTGPPGRVPDGFDALFERARHDAFSPEQAERLWQSLAAAGPSGEGGAGPGAAEGPGAPTRGGWASGALAKMGATLVVGGGLVAAVLLTRAPGPHGPVQAMSGSATIAQGLDTRQAEAAPPVVSWEDLPRAHESPLATARPRRSEPSSPAPPPPALSEPAALPTTAVEPEPAAAAGAPESETSTPSPAPAAGPTEGALLLRARRALASDPASTLALTEEDATRFPAGALAPEREVLAIEALTGLGRVPEARARFATFRARYPQSPHLGRLSSLVGP